jgi:hypothetical protein
MEDVMTDLEHQLRECLSQHADGVPDNSTLLRAVRTRSRELARRDYATGAVAVALVTGGIAVGADALVGSSTSSSPPATLHVSPAASSSPTAAARSAINHNLVLLRCKAGYVPKLGARHANLLEHVGATSLPAIIHRRFSLDGTGKQPVAIDYLKVVGHHGTERVLALEQVRSNGHVAWQLSVEHSPSSFTSQRAKFLGCAPRQP